MATSLIRTYDEKYTEVVDKLNKEFKRIDLDNFFEEMDTEMTISEFIGILALVYLNVPSDVSLKAIGDFASLDDLVRYLLPYIHKFLDLDKYIKEFKPKK